MDKATREYRKTELAKVATEYSEYKTRIKIIKPNGETKWLDIENDEFLAIQKILLGKSVVYKSAAAKQNNARTFAKNEFCTKKTFTLTWPEKNNL